MDIWIPRTLKQKPFRVGCGVGGEFRLIRYNEKGQVDYDSGWFDNGITNIGLTLFHSQSWFNRIHIGDSSQQFLHGDETLYGWLASSATSVGGIITENSGGPNYIISETMGRRFGPGVGTGTIRELGVAQGASNVDMAIRALVSPEVPKAAGQTLDVYYRFRIHPDLTDQSGTTFFDGVEYNYLMRGTNFGLTGSSLNPIIRFTPQITGIVYNGTIGATVADRPSGTISQPQVFPTITSSGSGFFQCNQHFELDEGNVSGGIRSAVFALQFGGPGTPGYWGWQIRFGAVSDDSPVPKDATYELDLNWRFEWDRH